MNKIIIDEYEKKLKNISGSLILSKQNTHIHLSQDNQIFDLKMEDQSTLIIELEKDATLYLEVYWKNYQPENYQIIINSKENTTLECNLYIEALNSFQLEMQNNVLEDNTRNKIIIHAITEDLGKCHIKTTGYIKKETHENEFTEILKGLTLNDQKITFLPNLIVDTDSVIANHNATISCLNEEEVFYLQSKGLTKEEAKELIKNGFLNKNNRR